MNQQQNLDKNKFYKEYYSFQDQNIKHKANMEDREIEPFFADNKKNVIVFGVLDGHGGETAVNIFQESIPKFTVELYE